MTAITVTTQYRHYGVKLEQIGEKNSSHSDY